MESLREFRRRVCNVNHPEHYRIIRSVNQYLCDYIASGEEVILPQKMGIISIRKRLRNIRIDEDGKIYSNLPVDW